MLTRFAEAASAHNSSWLKLSDLNQDSSRCEHVRQYISTEGSVWVRCGGALIASADDAI
ncbi:MAG: hypothetical protein ACI9TF_001576 [Paracrocinitomix sp.]|jgi:hypothetical protein|tara:strand:+ start:475 stop:651 length:177 start_codon:yes stop_codon:yes gene_type:complete